MISVYAITTLLAISSVAGQPSSYTQPTDRTDAPGLAPGVYAASGYLAQGPQPVTEPFVELYNGSYGYRAYPGGFQETVYYDKVIPIPTTTGMYAQLVTLTPCGFSSPHYHPGVTELNYVLEGDIAALRRSLHDNSAIQVSAYKAVAYNGSGGIAGLFLQDSALGKNSTQSSWATNLSKGGVATVEASSIHYAENPGCGNFTLLQVLSGLPKDYEFVPYIDLPAALLSQDATAMQFAYGMTDDQLKHAVQSVRPLFAVNTTCLALCNGKAASPSAAPRSQPTSG